MDECLHYVLHYVEEVHYVDESLQVLLVVEELWGQRLVAVSIRADDSESVQLAAVLQVAVILQQSTPSSLGADPAAAPTMRPKCVLEALAYLRCLSTWYSSRSS